MQLPSIDRIPATRPLATASAALATGRVVPVAPVNVSSTAAPAPSVINLINPADKPNADAGVYSSVADPTRPGSPEAVPTDWTVKKPAPEEAKPPPEPPLYQLLLDHMKSLWLASASAVQVQQEVKDQAQLSPPQLDAAQGVLTSQVYTYNPSKINKAEPPKS
ncbi:MAG: hypothetical protein PHQ13_01560 [Rhodoferax sp.]|nr:hypothetical protein [Rhodoferax sp.]